jgi:hypothetical protein
VLNKFAAAAPGTAAAGGGGATAAVVVVLTCVLLLNTFAAAVNTSSPSHGGALPGFTNSWPMHKLAADTGRVKRPCNTNKEQGTQKSVPYTGLLQTLGE